MLTRITTYTEQQENVNGLRTVLALHNQSIVHCEQPAKHRWFSDKVARNSYKYTAISFDKQSPEATSPYKAILYSSSKQSVVFKYI